MKVIYHCAGYIITISDFGGSWIIQTSGEIPKNVKNQIDEISRKRPKPDREMTNFLVKHAVKNDLQYIV